MAVEQQMRRRRRPGPGWCASTTGWPAVSRIAAAKPSLGEVAAGELGGGAAVGGVGGLGADARDAQPVEPARLMGGEIRLDPRQHPLRCRHVRLRRSCRAVMRRTPSGVKPGRLCSAAGRGYRPSHPRWRSPVSRRSLFRCAAPLTLLAGLAGCAAVGPDYAAPKPNWNPTTWFAGHPAAPPKEPISEPVEKPIDPQWWTVFHDPELTRLEQRLATANLDVRTASIRLAESRSSFGVARADLFPNVNGNASYTYQRISRRGRAVAGSRRRSAHGLLADQRCRRRRTAEHAAGGHAGNGHQRAGRDARGGAEQRRHLPAVQPLPVRLRRIVGTRPVGPGAAEHRGRAGLVAGDRGGPARDAADRARPRWRATTCSCAACSAASRSRRATCAPRSRAWT